jgi:hypothetical protein
VSSGFLGIVMGPRWRAEGVGGDGAPPSSWGSRGAAAPMAWGVGGTTSVSSGFLGIVIGPRWRAEEVGGDGAPPSKGFSRGAAAPVCFGETWQGGSPSLMKKKL